MRKLALALAVPALLAVAGCGADTKSCTPVGAQLERVPSGCTLAAGTTVQLFVRAHCDSCSHTQPRCKGESVGGAIELNPLFQECTEDRACSGSCTFGSFPCEFTTPLADGPLEVTYPSTSAGGLSSITVNVSSTGSTSCAVAALDDAPPAP
jgi:hypothetical protein